MRHALLLGLFLLARAAGISSPQDEIRKKQAELQTLRDQINRFEQKIRDRQKNEKATLELLDSYDRKATLLRRLIGKLRAEEQALRRDIELAQAELDRLGLQFLSLRDQFGRYVRAVYTAGRDRDVELLLSSRSVNQFSVRAEYLRRFTDQRRRDARRLTGKKTEIEERQADLQRQLSAERRVLAEKGAEEDRLRRLTDERRDILFGIRKDKKAFQRELDRKTQAARQLENLISGLIEADRLRREKETRDRALPRPPPAGGAFAERKGRLRWPVAEGGVVARFGNQRHPTLKTVTQNSGIDISVKAGTPVRSVAEGDVSTIWWLPGYGNLVILDHSGGYRTVYAHLSEIGVSEGQRVKEGDVIGASGESLEGPRLHFELWKDREKQNPEHWLSPP
ncbi:MAG: peptidoglycan DD-metalloendopeptidase family protein [Bacteroidota bacterium]